ncbi:MAG: amidohydrolase family protein [Syntrophorhabdaceae bacterium]|nr:amidohydrolase family protein [Syntrophorhabdaceae bacterium]
MSKLIGPIDVHIHGIGGFDTKDASPEDIIKIGEIQAENGVAGILPTVYPRSINDMRKDMENIKKAMELQEARGYAMGAKILGIHLEGPFLNPSNSGALDGESFLIPTEYNMRMLIDGFEDVIKIITVAPELDGALGIIKMITNMGIIVNMGHSDATYKEAEAGFNAGAKGITHIFNAMRGIHHREPGIAGFGLINPHVYIELISDPFHIHIKTIEMIFKIKDPSRIIIVSDAVKATGLISPVAHNSGGLQGGSMSITEAVKNLIDAGFKKDAILRCIEENPQRYLGLH